MTPILMGTTTSINVQSLGKIVQRAPAIGAKMWFLFFCLFVGHAPSPLLTYLTCVRRVHSSNKHCVAIYCPISMQFATFFKKVIPLSEALHNSHTRRQLAPQFSRNCGQKLRKVSKLAEKFMRITSYR